MSFDVARLGGTELVDADGDPHILGDLWRDRPAVLLFLRHFGWLTCRERAGQVRARAQEFVTTGVPVVAVGTGGKRYAAAFIEDERFPFPVLLDEDGIAAEVIEARSIGATTYLSPRAVAAGLSSFARGHRQRKTGRRPLQLGATLVIGPGDELLYVDYESFAGDHADLDEVLAAAT